MEDEYRQALKEWAVVEEAIAAGAVTLLLRKGGIHERQGDFGVEHRAFWIYPTGWHENRPDLAEHLHPFPKEMARDMSPADSYASVGMVSSVSSVP